MSCIICKYFLPFCGLCVHFVYGCLCHAKIIQVLFTYFFFKFSLLKEVDPKSYCCNLSQSVLPMCSFKSFIVSGPTVMSLIHLNLFLYMVLENVLILFFYMQLSSFPSTTYWNDCLYSIVHSCLLCCRLIDQNCMSLFWGYLPSSIHPLSLIFTWIHVLFTT